MEMTDPLARADYTRMGITNLANELARRKQTKRDTVVDSRTLRASVHGDTQKVMKLSVSFEGAGTEDMELTAWAHRQAAEKCGIPMNYYRKMLAGHTNLLAQNVNEWIGEKERRMVRTMDGKIRAILSDKYRTIDNEDLMFIALQKFRDHDAIIERCDLSDTHMYIKAIVPDLSVDVNEYRKSKDWRLQVQEQGHKWLDIGDDGADILQGGLVIRNSEVGASRFAIEPFVLRLKCNNGLIGMDSFAKTHLGARLDIGDITSDRTKALEDETLVSTIHDYINAAFDKERFIAWARNGLTDKIGAEITAPMNAIANVCKNFKMTDGEKDNILNTFINNKDNTQYGLVNAITQTARDTPSYDRQIELEKIAGSLVETHAADLDRLLSR